MTKQLARMLAFALALAAAMPALGHETKVKGLVVIHAHAIEPADPATRDVDVFMTIRNSAGKADRLIAAASPVAGRADLRMGQPSGDATVARAIEKIELPAGKETALGPKGPHVRLTGVTAPLTGYALLPLVLTFARAGRVEVEVLIEEPY